MKVHNSDYRDVLEDYDSESPLFYLDPPYVDKEAYYPVSDSFDHEKFVDRLRKSDGQFILSYGEALPDSLNDFRRELLEHPTGNRTEHLIFSYPEEEEGDFRLPTDGDALRSDW